MLTLAEILDYLSRWSDLTDDERGALTDALAAGSLTPDRFTTDELAEIAAALVSTADAILDTDGGPDDLGLEALEFIAAASEAITAEEGDRETAATDRANRAQELADRIRGGAGDDGEPAASGDDDDASGDDADSGDDDADQSGDDDGDSGDADDADASADDREPVAASGGARSTVSRVNARRPGAVTPRRTPARTALTLTASAGVPGVQMGARLDTPRLATAMLGMLKAMRGQSIAPGMKVPVATAALDFPDAGYLDGNVRTNAAKLEAHTSPAAVAAAGGICAPPAPRYDYPTELATDARPVRDGLTRFGADRGGVLLPSVPTIQDLDGAVSFWTTEDDVDALTDDEVRKPCLRVDCGEDDLVDLYAVVQCLEFGNFNARTWPERIARYLSLAGAWQARQAETRLLTRIGALSTQVSVPQNLGTARDVLTALDLAGAGMRNRHRMAPTAPLRWMAPAHLRDQMRSDLTREMPGSADERLAAADAAIETFFGARHINVSWFLDGEAGQVFGAQADGPLLGWMPNVVSYLFPEGSFLFLDGGELNLGLVRDSTLNARNDFQMFAEVFENVAFYGTESYRLSMTLCPTGAAAGTVEPVCTDVASS